MSFRNFLYALARIIGDFSAVRRGPKAIERRVKQRIVGKWLGRSILRKL